METNSTLLQPSSAPQPQDRIGAQAVVKADRGQEVTGIVRAIKTKRAWINGKWHPVEWAHVDIPGMGLRWIPASYFISWAW